MDDDKRMPPKDQPQLTKEETALLQWWITKGAATNKKVKDLVPDSVSLKMLRTFAGGGEGGQDTLTLTPLSRVFDEKVATPDPAAVAELTKLGLLVSPVAQNKALLEVSAINT